MRVIPSMCHAPVCSLFDPLFALFICLSHLLLYPLWIGSEINPLCASANEESGPLVNSAPLTLTFNACSLQVPHSKSPECPDRVVVCWRGSNAHRAILARTTYLRFEPFDKFPCPCTTSLLRWQAVASLYCIYVAGLSIRNLSDCGESMIAFTKCGDHHCFFSISAL